MEYIEREAIIQEIKEAKDSFSPTVRPIFDVATHLISHAPAADVAPVVHGTWSLESDEEMPNLMFKLVICSACGGKANGTYNFCPNCGADMREKKSGKYDNT